MKSKIPQNLPILSITEPEIYDSTSEIPSSLRDRMESVDLDFFDMAKKPQNLLKSEFHSSVGNLSSTYGNPDTTEDFFTSDNQSFNNHNIFQKPFVVR